MPREIKTTLAVDGEAAFKRAINDANTSIRNMGTQLTLATAQFKKDGDAMKLMESRSKTLKAEIEQQNEIVKALEKAVTDSTKAYGENSEKTEKWEAELNRAKARLVNLQSELTLNNAGLDRNGKAFDDSSEKAADYQATLQTIGKGVSFETITNGINGITSTVSAAITKVIELGKKVTGTMREAAQWADDLITESIINGLSVEDQQRMKYASKFADTSVDTIMSARDKLIKKMVGGWKNGDIDMWEFLGIDASTTRDPLDLMFELGETFRGVASADRNDTRADAWAMEVFGKGYRELLPLFNYGQDAFYNKMSEAPIVSDEDVETLGSLNDKLDEFDSRLNQLKKSVLAQLAPAMEGIVDSINDMLESFSEWIQTKEGKEAMSELSDAITELFSGLKNVEFKDVVEKAKDGIKGIKDALLWLAEHKNDVENALKIIAGGFGLLKVSELAINIWKIVDGFQALWDGANKPLPSFPGTGDTPTTAPTATGDSGDTVTGAAAGGGIMATVRNLMSGAAAKANEFVGSGGLWNSSFVADYFLHNTEAGRSINPEYGNSFSFQNLWDGIWRGVNEKIQDQMEANEQYGKETYNVLDPASKASYEAWQAQKQENAEAREHWAETHGDQRSSLPAWAQGFQTPEELMAYMANGATAAQRAEMEAYIREHPAPTQEEMNRELMNSRATWSAAPAELQTPKEPETTEEILRTVGGELTEAQKAAAEEWWDAYRTDPMGDEGDEKWEALEATFGDNEALLTRLGDAIDNWLTDPRNEDDSFLNNADLLSQAVQEMKTNTESGKTMADKVAGADFKRFNGLPTEMQAAVQRGAASGVSGIIVRLDGATVGRLVAPYVNAYLGSSIG